LEYQESFKVPSKETKSTDKPVILGDKILFHLATEAEGRTLAKRAEVVSERIKKTADSTRFIVDSIRTSDFNEPMTFIVTGDEILLAVLDHEGGRWFQNNLTREDTRDRFSPCPDNQDLIRPALCIMLSAGVLMD
jgi:hypothetical protein